MYEEDVSQLHSQFGQGQELKDSASRTGFLDETSHHLLVTASSAQALQFRPAAVEGLLRSQGDFQDPLQMLHHAILIEDLFGEAISGCSIFEPVDTRMFSQRPFFAKVFPQLEGQSQFIHITVAQDEVHPVTIAPFQVQQIIQELQISCIVIYDITTEDEVAGIPKSDAAGRLSVQDMRSLKKSFP